MPRGRTVRDVDSLDAYPWPDLSPSQVVGLIRRAGRRLELRTLHAWLRSGHVFGFKVEGNREWLIPKTSVRLLLVKCRRAA